MSLRRMEDSWDASDRRGRRLAWLTWWQQPLTPAISIDDIDWYIFLAFRFYMTDISAVWVSRYTVIWYVNTTFSGLRLNCNIIPDTFLPLCFIYLWMCMCVCTCVCMLALMLTADDSFIEGFLMLIDSLFCYHITLDTHTPFSTHCN